MSNIMMEVGSYEAKTKLAELLRIVETKGEEIFITRKGRKIAKLVPLIDQTALIDVIDEIRHIRSQINLSQNEIRDMIIEGRR